MLESQSGAKGELCLLSLPIGNLKDLTSRALEALKEGSYFVVEDTRTFKSLLNHLQIAYADKKIWSYHEHSSEKEQENILQLLLAGNRVYVASDAGSPLISDPAYPLVKEVIQQGIDVRTLPGVSSVLVALELSGLPPYPFFFYGFLPREEEKQKNFLQKILVHTPFISPL